MGFLGTFRKLLLFSHLFIFFFLTFALSVSIYNSILVRYQERKLLFVTQPYSVICMTGFLADYFNNESCTLYLFTHSLICKQTHVFRDALEKYNEIVYLHFIEQHGLNSFHDTIIV